MRKKCKGKSPGVKQPGEDLVEANSLRGNGEGA